MSKSLGGGRSTGAFLQQKRISLRRRYRDRISFFFLCSALAQRIPQTLAKTSGCETTCRLL